MGLVRGDVEREHLKPFWQAVDYDALETLRRRRPAGGAGSAFVPPLPLSAGKGV
jgi:hypothetical protein